MAKRSNGSNGNGTRPKPSLEERRIIHEQGVLQTLPSGVDVAVRPVTPTALLEAGKVPDILTPLVIDMLFEKDMSKTNAALDSFVQTPRAQREDALAMIESINAVCEAALVDPSQLPYLTYADRAYIFRMAFLPAEVLSRFRSQPAGDVARVDEGDHLSQAAV